MCACAAKAVGRQLELFSSRCLPRRLHRLCRLRVGARGRRTRRRGHCPGQAREPAGRGDLWALGHGTYAAPKYVPSSPGVAGQLLSSTRMHGPVAALLVLPIIRRPQSTARFRRCARRERCRRHRHTRPIRGPAHTAPAPAPAATGAGAGILRMMLRRSSCTGGAPPPRPPPLVSPACRTMRA